jgi:hypothetical protein
MSLPELERQVRALKVYSGALTAVVLFALFAAPGGALAKRPHYAEIDAERINIVEADGRLSLVLANTHRLPGPMLAGKELAKELSAGRIGSAGLIFVDAQGNEIGGLAYSATVRPDGSYAADSSLTFDQHNQDQVVGFQYEDDGSKRSYGVSVWDRPSKVTIAEMLDATRGAKDREARHQGFAALLKERGDVPGARRVFLGNQDRSAGLRVADTLGRERIRIYVDEANGARMEFLDEAGKVVYSVPERVR